MFGQKFRHVYGIAEFKALYNMEKRVKAVELLEGSFAHMFAG